MFERPPWAVATIINTNRGTAHIRRGWDFLLGYRTWCGRNLKSEDTYHVAHGAIQEWAEEQTLCPTCKTRWIKAYERNL